MVYDIIGSINKKRSKTAEEMNVLNIKDVILVNIPNSEGILPDKDPLTEKEKSVKKRNQCESRNLIANGRVMNEQKERNRTYKDQSSQLDYSDRIEYLSSHIYCEP